MDKLKAVCRIERATMRPAIFYRETAEGNNADLTVYTQQEGHSNAALEYYRTDTRPAKTEEEKCACLWLIAQYAQIVGKYDNQQLVKRSPSLIIMPK